MSDPQNENYVALKFCDFEFSPNIITEQLKITPNKTKLKGQKKGNSKSVWDSNMWCYEEKRITNEFIGQQVEEFVLRLLVPLQEEIKKVLKDCYGELAIVQYYYDGHNPGYHFSNEILSIISNIGLEIDIDTYSLGNTEK